MSVRVAIFGPLPSPGAVGGVATHTASLASALRDSGVAVRVLDDAHARGATPAGADGVRGASAAVRLRLALAARTRTTGRVTAFETLDALGVPRATARARSLLLASACRAFNPQVLHVQQADFRPLFADAAGLDMPRVIAVHGLGALETREYPGLADAVPANLEAAALITTPSRALAREVAALGIEPGRIKVIPNGVDHVRFYPRERALARERLGLDPDVPLVVFAGRVTVHKGAGDLAIAWAGVRRALPRARVAFVGPAGDADISGVHGAIAPGAVDPDTLSWWYAAADVVAVPSRYEGFGLVALEAMACGRAVVACAVGGLPEVVPAAAGVLVAPRDIAALEEAITAMLRDPDARGAAEAAARKAASAYTWAATAAAFANTYDTLLRC